MATVKLYFEWSSFRPDQRAYRQQSIDLFPMAGAEETPRIEIEIPLEGQYIANLEDILLKQTSGEIAPSPILTVKGLRYVSDLFDDVFYKTEESKEKEAKEDGWDNDPVEVADAARYDVMMAEEKAKKTDDWGDEWSETSAPTPVAVGPATNDEWAEVGTSTNNDGWDETKEDWG